MSEYDLRNSTTGRDQYNADQINVNNKSEVADAVDLARGIIQGIEVVQKIGIHLLEKNKQKKIISQAEGLVQESYQHEKQGNTTAQINCLVKAIEINPDCDAAYNSLAWTLALACKELDKALECAKKATLMKHTNPNYYDTLAEVYFVREEFDEAMIISQEALNLCGPNDKNVPFLVFHRAGRIHLNRKQFEEAISAFKKCLEINVPNSSFDIAGVLYGLAIAFKAIGKTVKSYRYIIKANELRPNEAFEQFANELGEKSLTLSEAYVQFVDDVNDI